MSKTTEPQHRDHEDLSAREAEVWDLICAGSGTTAIAKTLQISEKTVETHRTHINKKLGTRSAREIILRKIVDVATEPDTTADERIAAVLEVARRALRGIAQQHVTEAN